MKNLQTLILFPNIVTGNRINFLVLMCYSYQNVNLKINFVPIIIILAFKMGNANKIFVF